MVRRDAMLTLIPPANRVTALPPDDDYPFAKTPLTVAFATHDTLDHVEGDRAVRLAAAPELSCDDAYLLLPIRARDALLRAFARGRAGTIAAWFEQALVIRGEVEQVRDPRLWVADAWRAGELLDAEAPVTLDARDTDAINDLPWVRRLAHGGLVDPRGVATILQTPEYIGVSRRGMASLGLGRDALAPTFVWSTAREGVVHVRVALSADDDECVTCLLAPVSLRAGA